MNKSVIEQIQAKYGSTLSIGDLLQAGASKSPMTHPVEATQPTTVGYWKWDDEDFVIQNDEAGRVSVTEKEFKGAPTLTGGKVNYYLVQVEHPQREEQPPYQAECEDIIHALGMTFDEGCLFKALWRSVNARKGNGKPGNLPVYDAEKMVHYANRILKAAKNG